VTALPDLNFLDADAMIDSFERAAEVMMASPLRRGSTVHLPARGRILATGDIHDFPGHLEAIVRLAELDESPDHHVMLHELIHGETLIGGMDISYRNLAIVAELASRYPLQVHPLLANHELAQCHRMSVSKGGGDQVAMFDDGLDYVFNDPCRRSCNCDPRIYSGNAAGASGRKWIVVFTFSSRENGF